jgi:hypothetical protein
MARREETIVISDKKSRDDGKVFVIREMSAERAERWAIRALLALGQSGVSIPDSADDGAMAALANFNILKELTKIDYLSAEPLLNEMLDCIHFQPDPKNPAVTRPFLRGDDGEIEEVKTLLKLRSEIFKLHVNF